MIDGYKESPLGIIPITWETKTLGELLEVNTGDKNAQDSILDGEYPFFTRSITTQRIDSFSHDTEALFIAGEGIFKVKHYSGKFDVHQRTYVLTAKDKLNCSLKFFQNQIQSRIIKLVDTSVGSTVQSLRKPIIQELKLVIPPLPEQQKIAEILSTLDNKIEVIDQQIMETRELKKGLMQRLLTKGIGHSEFKDSPLGAIPKSWEVVKFENILRDGKGSLGYGILQPGDGVLNGINMVRTVDLTEVGRANTEILKVTERISNTSPTTLLEGGEILLSVMGTLGRTFVVPKEWKGWNVNRALAVIRTNKKIDSNFLCHFFRSPYFKRVIDKQSLGSAQMRINLNDLRKYDIPLPSIDEQIYISTQLSLVDDKLEVLKEKKETFQELKQGLMQQLLTGKIRVKV